MKIDNSIILSKLYMGLDNKLFKEGDMLDGRILKIIDNKAIIEIENLGILKAFVENNLDYYDGKILKFLVKSFSPDKIELKPIFYNLEGQENIETTDKGKDYLANILREFHIEEDPISMEILETLIKYNVEINEDNLTKGLRIYDKLDQLLNTKTDEVITIVNQEEENYDVGKVNIIKFLIRNKENMNSLQLESSIIGEENLTTIVKEYLAKGYLQDKAESDLIKIIGFFIKFNIKPTLNNFRYILELKENSLLFSEDFKTLEKIIDKKFTNFGKRVNIDNGSYNISIGKSNNNLKQVLDKIEELIKEDSFSNNKIIRQTIKELRNKMEFIDEINKELSFVYFPLNLNEKDYKGLITLFKRKKEKDGFKGKLNIFIDLKTKRLGDIKVSCQVIDSLMDIKFINVAKRDFDLFKSREDQLKDLVNATGYHLEDIEYLFTDDYSILDSLIINKSSTYFLDVQV
ncbi:MAG: hypothetical protein GX320_00480 [Tissierellia bacterium]|nr:hypothetical protein [Tissierellia bacterium]